MLLPLTSGMCFYSVRGKRNSVEMSFWGGLQIKFTSRRVLNQPVYGVFWESVHILPLLLKPDHCERKKKKQKTENDRTGTTKSGRCRLPVPKVFCTWTWNRRPTLHSAHGGHYVKFLNNLWRLNPQTNKVIDCSWKQHISIQIGGYDHSVLKMGPDAVVGRLMAQPGRGISKFQYLISWVFFFRSKKHFWKWTKHYNYAITQCEYQNIMAVMGYKILQNEATELNNFRCLK